MPVVLGVISDTHGLLRPGALAALAGVHRILHAGDVGRPDILDALASIAPVTAVRGNIDPPGLAESCTVEIDSIRIYMLHNRTELDFDPAARGYDVVITGHSHRARIETRDGVLYLNPGSAGPLRFRLPVTLARLRIDECQQIKAEIITLEP